ncbi:MAG: SGNH/GDSL hydrolase family protein [Vicinamibacteria bacterium]
MSRLRGRLSLLVLAAFGTLLGFLLLEAGARVLAVREERRQGRLDRDLAKAKGPGARAEVTLGQIIQKSANPRIVYELRPRLDVRFGGGRLTTSDGAYRGRDVAEPKPPGVYRMVGIGDSYMFGQGVSDEETYLARLPRAAPVVASGRLLETVNLAVPGFNTVMEVELLRERVAHLDPDLILIEIVGNDLDLPNFLWTAVDPWTPRRSFLLDFVRGRVNALGSRTAGAAELVEAPREDDGRAETFSRDADHVPARYASMVGLPAFNEAIDELAALGHARHVPVLALTHGVWFEREMKEALERNGILVLILRPALRRRARGLGAPDYARSPLALSPRDLHPSALGHEVIAEEVAAWLKTRISGR